MVIARTGGLEFFDFTTCPMTGRGEPFTAYSYRFTVEKIEGRDTLEKMEKRVEYDLFYITHWSVWLDIRIIFTTIFKGFVGEDVY